MKKGTSTWWDNVNTAELESKDDIIRKSLIDAVSELEEKFSANITNWQWRNLHTITFQHVFGIASPFLGKLLNIGPFPISGDGTTIFNTEYSFTEPYENKLGPAMRFLYDFSKPDELNFILPTGQSGYFLSDHYSDMTNMWLSGDYIKLNINTSNIDSRGYDLFRLLKEENN